MGRPSRSYQRIIPLPDIVSAMSSTMACVSVRGMAKPQGLVPSTGSAEPQGAISGAALVKAQPMRPAFAACSAWYPAMPKWLLWRTPTMAMPVSRAFSMARFMARCAAT